MLKAGRVRNVMKLRFRTLFFAGMPYNSGNLCIARLDKRDATLLYIK